MDASEEVTESRPAAVGAQVAPEAPAAAVGAAPVIVPICPKHGYRACMRFVCSTANRSQRANSTGPDRNFAPTGEVTPSPPTLTNSDGKAAIYKEPKPMSPNTLFPSGFPAA